jgi:hypothetical protein
LVQARPRRRPFAELRPPQFHQDPVEALPTDELQGVVVDPLRFPDIEHRHDVRMAEPRRRARLPLKLLHADGI